MLTEDQIAAGMQAAMDQIIAMNNDHEQADHDGEVCYANRAAIVAFVAHCLGVCGPNAWLVVQMFAQDFDDHCKQRDHDHD